MGWIKSLALDPLTLSMLVFDLSLGPTLLPPKTKAQIFDVSKDPSMPHIASDMLLQT